MNEPIFTYTSFDRQLCDLLTMASVVLSGWEDYSSMEMNLDLKSLTLKAAKVCSMLDEDKRRQANDIVRERAHINETFCNEVTDFVFQRLHPFILRAIDQFRQGNGMKGRWSSPSHLNIADILPQLAELTDSEQIGGVITATATLEKILKKRKSTIFPGMMDIERFWMLYEFYAHMCYIMQHFRQMHAQTHTEIDSNDIGRLLQTTIQQYAQSAEGEKELACYLSALRFDHDGELSTGVLKEARTALRMEVPKPLQLCFMQHIGSLDALGRNLLEIEDKTPEDTAALFVVLAKWQLLTEEMDKLEHRTIEEKDLPNEVFHTMLHDRRVSMKELRERIARMLPLITRKNHWFCVWSVLNYHNLIKNTNTEAFARQMLMPEWFGTTKGVLQFSGDTLREYTGYFTGTTFRAWDNKSFLLYRKVNKKTKWSETLCDRFQRLCEEMNDCFAK